MIKKNFGGPRLGTGHKMEVKLKSYERSTHDLGYLWRSSMAPGTLVPFMVEIALPGDTFDIDLEAEVRTHPTLGPLFGSFKLQLDVFEAPMRLYNAQLHNNELGIGLHMNNVIFPASIIQSPNATPGPNSYQINPSSLYAYLGIRGVGTLSGTGTIQRNFNAMPLLAYWEIYKNYYANKQETAGYYIHSTLQLAIATISSVTTSAGTITTSPGVGVSSGTLMTISYAASTVINLGILNQLILNDQMGNQYQPLQLYSSYQFLGSGGATPQIILTGPIKTTQLSYYSTIGAGNPTAIPPQVTSFPLANIDTMRTNILQAPFNVPYTITNATIAPYGPPLNIANGQASLTASQEALALKTYQSDLFNNWLATATYNQIASSTAVSTAAGSFTIDQLNTSKKVWDLLNRVAVSGGTYDDWIETVYTAGEITRAETPMYHGGMSKEILFQEVVSTASAVTANNNNQPLGTLAGHSRMGKRKNGQVRISIKEPAIIIGIVSITPRIDYSQGNHWMYALNTMDDLHKPALDEIGFGTLQTDWMAYWDTTSTSTGNQGPSNVGYQPAWIQYMTNVNKTYGNFAIPTNEMFMTLNRRYSQVGGGNYHISDLTQYIDPSLYNFIFAQTSIDAQNFWTQIAVNITARRKMSAKIMPNL